MITIAVVDMMALWMKNRSGAEIFCSGILIFPPLDRLQMYP
jgi:hypothetical protein